MIYTKNVLCLSNCLVSKSFLRVFFLSFVKRLKFEVKMDLREEEEEGLYSVIANTFLLRRRDIPQVFFFFLSSGNVLGTKLLL